MPMGSSADSGNHLNSAKIDPTALVENTQLLAAGTRVKRDAKLIGEVRTADDVVVDFNAVIYGPVQIGKRTYVGPNCVIGYPDSEELAESIGTGHLVAKRPTILGERCVVRSSTTIYSDVSVADSVFFGHNVMVREGVTIGSATKVGTNVVVDGKTVIGARVSIQTGVYICTYSTIEDGVFLGPCCVLTNDKYLAQKPFNLIGPTVKRGASIGANAVLFPGIVVGEGAVVGSQALVNTDVPAKVVFAGIPAKKLRDVPGDWNSGLLEK